MKKTITLPKLMATELERIEEVKFYLFTSRLTKLARGSGVDDDMAIIKEIANLCPNISQNLLVAAVNMINSISCKPQELEVAITCKVLNIQYAFVSAYVMNNRKYKTLMDEFINNRERNVLYPKLMEDQTAVVIAFNKFFVEKLAPAFEFLMYEPHQDMSERWDD